MRKLVIMAIVLCAACGTDSVALDDYPVEFRDALCRYLVKCGDVENIETCRKVDIGITIGLSTSKRAAIDMGKTKYDGAAAQKCFDALAGRSCDPTIESSRVLPDACRDLAQGTLRDGAACAFDNECRSEECNVPDCDMACCTGACVGDAAPARAKLGESCEIADCEDKLYCDRDAAMCVALKPADAFCAVTAECAFGLGCLSTGTCAVLPGPGAPVHRRLPRRGHDVQPDQPHLRGRRARGRGVQHQRGLLVGLPLRHGHQALRRGRRAGWSVHDLPALRRR